MGPEDDAVETGGDVLLHDTPIAGFRAHVDGERTGPAGHLPEGEQCVPELDRVAERGCSGREPPVALTGGPLQRRPRMTSDDQRNGRRLVTHLDIGEIEVPSVA